VENKSIKTRKQSEIILTNVITTRKYWCSLAFSTVL